MNQRKKSGLELGVPENHIFSYGPEKNWWSRTGVPDNMPDGEPGGPDSEVFYDFGQDFRTS
jgi:alanyl-tRNA synthetase